MNIDKIKINGYIHFVYYKTPIYWLVSRYNTKHLMFSVLVDDLTLSKKQKEEQSQLVINRMDDLIKEKENL